jgi:hypothetical protein
VARKRKRARPSGGHRQPSRARDTKTRSTSIVRETLTRVNIEDLLERSRSARSESKVNHSFAWTLHKFNVLPEKQQDTYFRAKHAISEIRKGKSASQAARDNKTTLATVRRYFAGDFIKLGASRRWTISKSDKHVNRVPWLGPEGYEPFLLRGTKEVSRLAHYSNDVKRALRGGASVLDKWQGKRIGGRKLITDLEVLTRLANEGKLDFEEEIQWRS